MSKRIVFFGIIVTSLLISCKAHRNDKSARQRYHVKRGCGCTSYYIKKNVQAYFIG